MYGILRTNKIILNNVTRRYQKHIQRQTNYYLNPNIDVTKQNEVVAYLVVCLIFSLALRVGELVALTTSCINDGGTIDIIREEVRTYIKYDDGSMHRNGYEVVNHTKTQCGKRKLVLTPNAKKYIQMAIERNKELGISDGDYIFLNKDGNRIHDHAVKNVLRRLNGVRNEKMLLLSLQDLVEIMQFVRPAFQSCTIQGFYQMIPLRHLQDTKTFRPLKNVISIR